MDALVSGCGAGDITAMDVAKFRATEPREQPHQIDNRRDKVSLSISAAQTPPCFEK